MVCQWHPAPSSGRERIARSLDAAQGCWLPQDVAGCVVGEVCSSLPSDTTRTLEIPGLPSPGIRRFVSSRVARRVPVAAVQPRCPLRRSWSRRCHRWCCGTDQQSWRATPDPAAWHGVNSGWRPNGGSDGAGSQLANIGEVQHMLDMASDLVSLADASQLLGVSSERVRQLVVAGDLPGVRFGNAWAVPRGAVAARRQVSNRRGRPLGERRAWEAIASGGVDLSNVSRYRNRGVVERYSMSATR